MRAEIPVIAVSPLIGGAAVKGPAAKIMNELGLPVSPLEIARQYRDFLDVMLIDERDRALIGAAGGGRSAHRDGADSHEVAGRSAPAGGVLPRRTSPPALGIGPVDRGFAMIEGSQ